MTLVLWVFAYIIEALLPAPD